MKPVVVENAEEKELGTAQLEYEQEVREQDESGGSEEFRLGQVLEACVCQRHSAEELI
jgi:hypothetical protein